MTFKNFWSTIIVTFILFSCTEDNDVTVPRNLQEYIETISDSSLGEVIACAAAANGNKNLS